MSGVHEKDREEIPALTKFRMLARDIDDEATRIAANVITKHYRFVIGVQLANAAMPRVMLLGTAILVSPVQLMNA